MTQIQLELFPDKSRKFLYSRTDTALTSIRQSVIPAHGESHHPGQAYSGHKTGSAPGFAFMLRSARQLEESSRFSALAIQMDDIPEEFCPQFWSRESSVFETLAGFFRDDNALLGRLNPGCFGCFLLDALPKDARTLADRLTENLLKSESTSISIGIAGYPMVNYAKAVIMENAFKALDHAAFFGPSSIVCFDSVSLNISGDKLYEEGNIDGAIHEFTRALMIDPTNVNVHNSIGVCYGLTGAFDRALEAFDNAKWLDPGNAMSYYNRGLIFLLSGEPGNALTHFLEADQIDANVFEVLFQIGKLYLERSEYEISRSYLERAEQLNGDSAMIHRYLGDCYAAVGMTDRAIQAYTRAVKKNANDAFSLSALGCLYADQETNEEIASVFCHQSVDISPDSGLFRFRLGKVYMKQQKIRQALDQFKLAVKLGHDASREITCAEAILSADAS
jgi:tetratricopeptide (TPR) repeat protein